MRTIKETIISAGDASAATLTSSSIDMSQMATACLQAILTGTPAGSLQAQASCDGGTTWVSVGSAASISGTTSQIIELSNCGYPLLRAVYTKSGGSGTVTVIASAKGF